VRIAFRVDASRAIGTGHLMRCLTLADALVAEGHGCAFVARDHADAPLELIEARGHAVHRLLVKRRSGTDGDLAHSHWLPASQERDSAETLASLGDGFDWMVVDHYALDARWHGMMRQAVDRLLVIDDLADRQLDCDILVDQNLQEAVGRYAGLVRRTDCRTLLGPRFAIIAPAFERLRGDVLARPIGDVARLSVFLGGMDVSGATILALNALTKAGVDGLEVDVIANRQNPRFEEIAEWCDARKAASLIPHASDMASLLARADLAIGAGGVTMWERCCLGIPSVVVIIAKNQRSGARAIAFEQAAVVAGDASELDEDRLASILGPLARDREQRSRLRTKSSALVDGKGRNRVVRAMTSPGAVLREAAQEDCDAIWRWRNDPETRRYFFNPESVDLSAHREWFERVLGDPDRILLIAESRGIPVGVLRFDVVGLCAVISVYLAPGQTGRGLGTDMLLAGSAWLTRNRPAIRSIEAEVLPENIASCRAFAAAGYVPVSGKFRHTLR
jgi:UDP-2,4-diacetamido-2,4,6-trideoxy-beta-L-altropyranose hydrolase